MRICWGRPIRSGGGGARRRRAAGIDGTHWYDRLLQREGARLFDGVAQLFRDAAAAVVNLEGVLSTRTVAGAKRFTFRRDPSFTRVLAKAGVRVATLGNNRAFDCGVSRFSWTRDVCCGKRVSGVLERVSIVRRHTLRRCWRSLASGWGFSDFQM